MKEAAHTLKGAGANIGAVAAASLCADLERLESGRDLRKGPELLTRLEAELRLVEEALDRSLAAAP